MWTPDVYEGAPTPVTAFFAVAPKVATMALILRLVMAPFEPAAADWQQIIVFVSIASMAVGSFAAIGQRNFKRLMAYSSIGHMGFALVGLSANSQEGVRGVSSVLYYLLAYVFMNIGAFAVLTWLEQRGRGVTLDDIAGLANTDPLPAAAMAIFMVSLMGIPPLIGFYAKYYVIVAAIEASMLWLAIAVVIASGISAYFYLRVVAVMYFSSSDQPDMRPARTQLLNAGLILLVVGNLALGLFSAGIVDLSDEWTSALTNAHVTADTQNAAQVSQP
jgi:NADH-quinone oxidoreductase subunit N